MAIFLVLLKTHTGTAAAHYVDADAHETTSAGTHQLFRDERLVWQGAADAVRGVRRFEDRAQATGWHKRHRTDLAAEEMSYRHEHSTGDGASPFIGGVSVRFAAVGDKK
mgnify:CR=1 FL=1